MTSTVPHPQRPVAPTIRRSGPTGRCEDGWPERFRRTDEARVGLGFSALRIEVVGVVLCGAADSHLAKQVAQHVAASLTGLPVLTNRIRVKPQTGRKVAHLSLGAPGWNEDPR